MEKKGCEAEYKRVCGDGGEVGAVVDMIDLRKQAEYGGLFKECVGSFLEQNRESANYGVMRVLAKNDLSNDFYFAVSVRFAKRLYLMLRDKRAQAGK